MIKDLTIKYAKEVLAGNIVAGEYVKLACMRHMNDLKRSKTKKFEWKFDTQIAEKYFRFFGLLQHSKGKWAGKPIMLELWQCFIVGSIFGWVHKKTGVRKYKTSYTQIARKNGKSTLMAGIGLAGFTIDGEQGAEVYSVATKKDQARIIFDEAVRMVKSSPYIKEHISVYRNNMSMPSTNSKFEPLSSDANSLDGLNLSMGLVDELHAHKTRDVWDVLETATGARTQALINAITTAGFNINGICHELYDYVCNVLKGVIEDERIFGYIAQLDKDDDPFDEANWIKANPNLGVSVNIEDLRAKAKKAKEIPAAQNNFFCKHLNMWVNQKVRWMPMDKWKECQEVNKDFDVNTLISKSCYVGVDLSATTDITSVSLEFPLENGYYAVINHSFIPEENIEERERRDKVSYTTWIREGYMTATPGNVVDYDWIQSYIMEMAKKYKIIEMDYDPWNATQFANNMMNEGVECVEIRQGYRTLSEPTKDILKIVLAGKLIYLGNPVLTWSANNAVAVSDPAGNIKLDKSKAEQRIDPIISLITCHVRAMLDETNNINADEYFSSDDFTM